MTGKLDPMRPKEISKEQIYEYFQYINRDSLECPWSQAQASAIGEALLEIDQVKNMLLRIGAMAGDIGVYSVALSSVVLGFQCGREFENRLMAKAIREGK